jgi:hypothetical protein
LRPAACHSEPRDDFVEDQDGAVGSGDLAQVLEESGRGRDWGSPRI